MILQFNIKLLDIFFTLRGRFYISSSWFDQTLNFRQEIHQSHYRNDPVKYDLKEFRHCALCQVKNEEELMVENYIPPC